MAITTKLIPWCRTFLRAIERELPNRQLPPPPLLTPHLHLQNLYTFLTSALFLLLFRFLIIHLISKVYFPNSKHRLHKKLSENLYYTIYHTTSTLLFLYVYSTEPWSIRPFSNTPIIKSLITPRFPVPSERLQFMYMFDLGFWFSALFFLIFFDRRLSDFKVLFFHHLATLSLMTFSYIFGYIRFGIIILALHDVGDIFLYGAKFIHYLGIHGPDTFLFAIFAVLFYVMRLIILPRLIFAASVESLQLAIDQPGINEWGAWIDRYIWHWAAMTVLLSALMVLHCFWFSLVVRMIWKEVVLGKKVEERGDIRDSSDDESEHED